MKTKICTKCGKELPVSNEYFSIARSNKDGFKNICKTCQSKIIKQYRETHKEEICEKKKQYNKKHKGIVSEKRKEWLKNNKAKSDKKWRENNKEHIRERAKKWREDNKERIAKSKKEYQEKNKERIREKSKKYREEHKEQIAEGKRIYYKNNKEKVAKKCKIYNENHKEEIREKVKLWALQHKEEKTEYGKAYYEKHKNEVKAKVKIWVQGNRDRARIISHRRRYRERQLPNTLTDEQWKSIKQCFSNKCAYCGKSKKLTIEHFIPLSKGGELSKDNIVPACKTCNCSKGAKPFKEWYKNYKYYSKEREKFILDFLGYKKDKQQLSMI